ncbi:MAG: methyltransferase domain-containing protein [Burkholderiales bacterium]|nr:methyltransferase domain-containing protein [Burkholderiales bacterium]
MSDLDRHAAAYTPAFAHFEENRIVHAAYGQRLRALARERGARSVLSLGVGHQEVAQALLEALRSDEIDRHVLIDAAPQLLADFARDQAPLPAGLELVEAWFEQYQDAQGFDLIEAGFVLEHVDDPALLLRHLRSLLRPGGLLCVAVPNATSLHRRLGHAAGLLPDMFQLGQADLVLGHRRYFDPASLSALAEAAGWQALRCEGLLLKPFTTGQLERLALAPEIWRALQQVAAPYPELSNAFCMDLQATGA